MNSIEILLIATILVICQPVMFTLSEHNTTESITSRPILEGYTSTSLVQKNYLDEVKNECGRPSKTRFARVAGGIDSYPLDWQWAVPIFDARSFQELICGATLISRKHVLTSAQCTQNRRPKDIFIRVGILDIRKDEEDEEEGLFTVIKITQHPQYDNKTAANDIAILTLKEEVELSYKVFPACIPEQSNEDYVRDYATVIGWGATSYLGNYSNRLKEVTVPIWSVEDCQNVYGKERINDKQICAGLKEGGKDSCQGDTGGPLSKYSVSRRRYEVIGIVSFGFRCGEPNYPGVYTKVNRYAKWIAEQTTFQ